MNTRAIALLWTFLFSINCTGQDMDANGIKQLMARMDDSLYQGYIYHINYVVSDKRTDAFYSNRRERIKWFSDGVAKEERDTPLNLQDAAFEAQQQARRDVVAGYERELKENREQTCYSDLSFDGIGFYLDQRFTYITYDGRVGAVPPTIYVSDGKIMGTFYSDKSQAVIEPACERPRSPTPFWTNIAYLFVGTRPSVYMSNGGILSLKEENGSLVINNQLPMGGKEICYTELRINKATLTPESLSLIYYDTFGTLYCKQTKTWQFQNVSGVMIPKTVVDLTYLADIRGKLNLEQERTFTINQFDPTPTSGKAEFDRLLKGNWSVFDEVTGNHYLSGNPGQMLDRLSQ